MNVTETEGMDDATAAAESHEGATAEAGSEETSHAADAADDKVSKLESIVERLARQQAETLTALKAAQAEKAKPKQLTKDELIQKWQDSPVEVLESVIEAKLEKSTKRIEVDAQKTYWDQKAQSEFPTNDPKFRAAMEQAWIDLTEDGYDTSNPKALYRACKDAALQLGVKGKQVATSQGVKPTGGDSGVRPQSNPMRKSTISENDPRLVFYKMQFRPDAKKLQDFVKKLEADDARRTRRR